MESKSKISGKKKKSPEKANTTLSSAKEGESSSIVSPNEAKSEFGLGKKKKKGAEKSPPPKTVTIEVKSKLEKFDLYYIYRRESFQIKNLLSNFLVSGIKKLIAKKLNIELNNLKFYYKDCEMKDDTLNVYDMIKDEDVKFIKVKKEAANNENIISLNIHANLIYKVKCTQITDYINFVGKIEQFFRDICLECHYLCEPTEINAFEVGFAFEDLSFQFRRYMMGIKKDDPLYKDSTFEYIEVDKSKVIKPDNDVLEGAKNTAKTKKKINDFPKDFLNSGPYISMDEIKKKEEKDEKKKWIYKKGFSVI